MDSISRQSDGFRIAQGAPATELAVAFLAMTPDGSAAPTTRERDVRLNRYIR